MTIEHLLDQIDWSMMHKDTVFIRHRETGQCPICVVLAKSLSPLANRHAHKIAIDAGMKSEDALFIITAADKAHGPLRAGPLREEMERRIKDAHQPKRNATQ